MQNPSPPALDAEESDEEGDEPTLVVEGTWECRACTFSNARMRSNCASCLTPKSAPKEEDPPPIPVSTPVERPKVSSLQPKVAPRPRKVLRASNTQKNLVEKQLEAKRKEPTQMQLRFSSMQKPWQANSDDPEHCDTLIGAAESFKTELLKENPTAGTPDAEFIKNELTKIDETLEELRAIRQILVERDQRALQVNFYDDPTTSMVADLMLYAATKRKEILKAAVAPFENEMKEFKERGTGKAPRADKKVKKFQLELAKVRKRWEELFDLRMELGIREHDEKEFNELREKFFNMVPSNAEDCDWGLQWGANYKEDLKAQIAAKKKRSSLFSSKKKDPLKEAELELVRARERELFDLKGVIMIRELDEKERAQQEEEKRKLEESLVSRDAAAVQAAANPAAAPQAAVYTGGSTGEDIDSDDEFDTPAPTDHLSGSRAPAVRSLGTANAVNPALFFDAQPINDEYSYAQADVDDVIRLSADAAAEEQAYQEMLAQEAARASAPAPAKPMDSPPDPLTINISYAEMLAFLSSLDMHEFKIKTTKVLRGKSLTQSAKYALGGRPTLGQPELQAERALVFNFAEMTLDNKYLEHQRCMQTLYRKLTGSDAVLQTIDSTWTEIGFQNPDPSTDLRGSGMLGLLHLLFLVDGYLPFARRMWTSSQKEYHTFPLVLISFNLTCLAKETLRGCLLYNSIKERKSVWRVVNELYVGLMYCFFTKWEEKGSNANVSQWSPLYEQLQKACAEDPIQLITDLQNSQFDSTN
jgi:hypothetical protein